MDKSIIENESKHPQETAEVSSAPPVTLEQAKSLQGYLLKKSPNILKKYQKRFFRIIEGQVIVYTESEDDKTLKGQIQINQITSIDKDGEKKFVLNTQVEKDFTLKAENTEERDMWYNCINLLILTYRQSQEQKKTKILDPNAPLTTENSPHIPKITNKMTDLDKKTLDLIRNAGFNESKTNAKIDSIIEDKGINKLLNLNNPEIKSRL